MGFLDTALRAISFDRLRLGTGNRTRSYYIGGPNPEYPEWTYPDGEEISRAINEAHLSSLVAACCNYRANNAVSTPWVLMRRDGSETETEHPVLSLLNRPNAYSDGRSWLIAMWKALDTRGNAYALKVGNGAGALNELWHRPPTLLRPITDSRGMLESYEYKVSGQPAVRYEPDDVVHIRYPNPEGAPWDGLSPLTAVGLELWLDRQATRDATSIVKNGARPGMMISLEPMDEHDRPTLDELNVMKDQMDTNYTGLNKGKAAFFEFPIRVHPVANPADSATMGEFHNFAEERISGVYGLPAALVQFRAGLERTTANATLREWERQGWHGSIIPTQDLIADQLSYQLLPDFGLDPKEWVLGYDRSGVEVLQADQNAEAERWSKLVGGPIADLAEARAALNLEVDTAHEGVYWLPLSLTPTPLDELMVDEPDPPPMPPMPPPQPPQEGEDDDATRALPRMSRRARALVRALERSERQLRNQFARELETAFDSLGRSAEAAFRQQGGGTRQLDADDEALLSRIIGALNVQVWQQEALVPAFDRHYVRTLTATVGGINTTLGLNVNLPDPVQRQIIAEGGTRLGLLDIGTETRDAVFRALEEGRAAGEGADALARRIRNDVGAGRFTKAGAQYRARMIARTETKHAQNRSSAETYRAAGIEQVQLIDDQLGYGDEECSARNGQQVPLDEGERVIGEEHPNGTLRLVPTTSSL